MPDIRTFLVKARQHCYTSGAKPTKPTTIASFERTFKEGMLTYKSTILGGLDYNLHEVIWEGNKPVWSMNLSGRVVADGFNGGILKEALLEIEADFPYRGPELFVKGDYTYISKVEGNLAWFKGREELYYQDRLIYEGNFHGGYLT